MTVGPTSESEAANVSMMNGLYPEFPPSPERSLATRLDQVQPGRAWLIRFRMPSYIRGLAGHAMQTSQHGVTFTQGVRITGGCVFQMGKEQDLVLSKHSQ
jgi:hypothetical protein